MRDGSEPADFFEDMPEYRILEGKRGVKQAYDEMAETYDGSKYLAWTRKMEEAEWRAVRDWMKRLSSPVLDVGCGTGRHVLKLAAEGLDLIGLDVSGNMLSEAVAKFRDTASARASFIQCDGEHLPLKDGAVHSIICSLTFGHFEDCGRAALEFARVSRRDGYCILTTFNEYALREFKERYGLLSNKVPFQTENMPATLIYEVGHSVEEIEELFGEKGYRVINIKGCCYWHVPMPFWDIVARSYKPWMDALLNFVLPSRYAELHLYLMKK